MQGHNLFEESPEGVKVIALSVCKKTHCSKMGCAGLNPSFAHILGLFSQVYSRVSGLLHFEKILSDVPGI